MKMTSLKRCLSGLLAALMLVTLLPTSAWAASTVASGTCGDNLTWVLDSTGTLTISGTGEMWNYDGSYNKAPWYGYRDSIEAAVIQRGITSIGNLAFFCCSNLISIAIPNSVTSIGAAAFQSCSSLTDIAIPNSVTSIGNCLFFYCHSLTSISVPASTTSIGDYAFSYCRSLKTIRVASGNPNYSSDSSGVLFNKAKTELICCPGGFSGSYTIPGSVTHIVGSAFLNCESLTSVTISDGLLSTGAWAFEGCTELKTVYLPKSLTSVQRGVFYACSSLSDVYYTGTETQWGKISISSDNYYLLNATIHYNWAPAAPKISSTTVASSGAIKLTWNKVDGAAKYYIYRSTDGGSTYKYYDSTTKTSYTNTSVTPGKTYYYKLKATASGATSKYSNAVSRTADCARPVVKISNVASSGAIKLSWSAVTGASKYYIYRSTDGGKTYSYYTSTTSTSWTNKSVTPGKTYYYKVKAICGKSSYGNSAYSAVVSRTADCAKPVVTIQLNGGKPQLKWKAITGAEEYVIYRATSKSGTYTKMYTTTKLSYTNTGAKSGTTYYYKVKAICGRSSYGNSAYSSVVSIRSK